MKKTLVIAIVLLASYAISDAGSIILPYWQDDATPVYSMFAILNTGTTSNLVNVMFYSDAGAAQSGTFIERSVANRQLEVFGTGRYPGDIKMATTSAVGYAQAFETGGNLLAVGLVYDAGAQSGYTIPCFPGNDDGTAASGW